MSGSFRSLPPMSTTRRVGTSPRRPDPTRAARLQREAGFERSRTITKGVAFGSVAAVAAAGIYLSQALPGHTTSTGSTGSGATSAGASTPAAAVPSGGSAASQGSGISTPAAAPTPAYQQAPVVSGSS